MRAHTITTRIRRRLRPSPAMAVAFAALFVALGGTALSQGTPPPGTAPVTCRVLEPVPNARPDHVGLAATIVGTEGNDVLSGTPGRDVIAGLGGDDMVSGLAGNDVICGGPGNDTLKGGKGNDELYGHKGNDKLYGREGNDKLFGQTGNDALNGGPTADSWNLRVGGKGKDTSAHGQLDG